MRIVFEQEYLSGLYNDGTGDKKHRYQPDVVKKYRKVVNILKQAKTVEDLFPFNSLNYEKLSGDKAGIDSVRINDKYRLEFKTKILVAEIVVTVCHLLELSNHNQ